MSVDINIKLLSTTLKLNLRSVIGAQRKEEAVAGATFLIEQLPSLISVQKGKFALVPCGQKGRERGPLM